jgi:cyclohexanone monooxygenase
MASVETDVVVVGAGFSGLYLLHKLRGLGLKCKVIEAGSGVGGTWFWNRYPGLRCDVESMTYSYSFSEDLQREWSWSQRYAKQAEILRYINHVVDRFDLERDIELNTTVNRALCDQGGGRWTIETDRGDAFVAPICVMATGCLSVPHMPKFEGIEDFCGDWYHTADWPEAGVDFVGKHVAVVGTGSSGVQSIPVIAQQAKHLTVFQRTANFSIPAWNHPLDAEAIAKWRSRYPHLRQIARESRAGLVFDPPVNSALEVSEAERKREFEKRWQEGSFSFLSSFNDILVNEEASELAAEFVRAKIREKVHDPMVAEILCPRDVPIGTKRLCVDTDYYETFNRANVRLVDIRYSPIDCITPRGIRVGDREFMLDAIVFATGYDAMTGALFNINIRGRGGIDLKEKWAEGPRTYLGLAMTGFPNLFMITGPGSPSVVSNMMVSIEQHVEWITDCLDYMRRNDVEVIEATPDAEEAWTKHVNDVAAATLFPRANSWYMGVNIPGKPQICMPYVGGVGSYKTICDEVAAKGYEGFALTRTRRESAAAPRACA